MNFIFPNKIMHLTLIMFFCSTVYSAEKPEINKASWIWTSPNPTAIGEWECYTSRQITLDSKPVYAEILITADNVYELFINGKFIGQDGGYDSVYWQSIENYDIAKLLKPGKNVIAARAKSLGGSGGLIFAGSIQTENNTYHFCTDSSWPVTKMFDDSWQKAMHDSDIWIKATVIGSMGSGPWGMLKYPGPVSPLKNIMLSWMETGDDFNWPNGIVYIKGHVPLKEPQNFTVNVHGSRAYFEHDSACPPAIGRQLYKLTPANPDGKHELLVDAGDGLISSPCVSYDGQSIFFCMVPEGDKFFRIFRIDSDGSNLKQLTFGRFHDYEPEIMPDGRIVFVSTRLGSRDEYHGNLASSIFIMNADGSGIEPLTYHIVADHEPKVTSQGTIAFVRCDNFFERAKVETRIHHIRPDGTGGMAILGPDRGTIGYDPAYAAEVNSAWLRINGFGSVCPTSNGRIAAISQYGLVSSGLYDSGSKALEKSPFSFVPFDISPLPDERSICTGPGRSWIGIMDWDTGKVAKIISDYEIHSPVFLGKRKSPPTRPVQLPFNPGKENPTGYLLCQNIFNTKQSNADLSQIKAVRIIQGKPFSLRSTKHRFVHLGVEGVELGTVPLAPDGSFYVEVPADKALAIQAIDGEGRSVINETTWIYVRPDETLACVGCHNHRTYTPSTNVNPMAARFEPVRLFEKANSHRFRANNGGNGGVLNLQFDRFREAAAINLYSSRLNGEDRDYLCDLLEKGNIYEATCAADKLAILRDGQSVAALIKSLKSSSWQLRMHSGLALSACGDASAIEPLLDTLNDSNIYAAQAANIALENMTTLSTGFNAFENQQKNTVAEWKKLILDNSTASIEKILIEKLQSQNASDKLDAARALGRIGSDGGKKALRNYLERYPEDNLRISMAVMRSLGHLKDTDSVPILTDIFNKNCNRNPGAAKDLHELGWLQKPVYLSATAAEALGRIGGDKAEKLLLDKLPKLGDFWNYSFRTGDHSWLMGCHSSVLHWRIIEAIDRMKPNNVDSIVPTVLKSIPIDTDRALLFENDSYEVISARIINRSTLADTIIKKCIALLVNPSPEPKIDPADKLLVAITASPPAVSVLPQDPKSRAAQILSIVCYDKKYTDQIADIFDGFRTQEPSRQRAWSSFFLARLMSRLEPRRSVQSLHAALLEDAREADFGFEDPPNVFIYKAMTPFYRAAAADSLGRIDSKSSIPVLAKIVADFDNAISVRHAAAASLMKISGGDLDPSVKKLARSYPEISIRQVLNGTVPVFSSEE